MATNLWETRLDGNGRILGTVQLRQEDGVYIGYRAQPICPGANWEVTWRSIQTGDFPVPTLVRFDSAVRNDVVEWVDDNPVYEEDNGV